MATVTAIIPTYNRANLVARAVRSALAQTHKELEVIVVDDGSADDTSDKVSALCDPRVRYIRHEGNKGLPAARNTGIRASSGQFIAFLDDDDEWRPTKLERQLTLMDRFDACLTAVVFGDGRVKKFPRTSITLEDLRRGNVFDPSSMLVKRAVLARVMFDETLRIGEDWDVFIRLAMQGPVGYLNEPLTVYNEGSQTMTAESRNLPVSAIYERMSMLNKHRDFFGPFWLRYHVADHLLSYLRYRRGKFRHVYEVVGRCGPLAVLAVLQAKIRRRARYHGIAMGD